MLSTIIDEAIAEQIFPGAVVLVTTAEKALYHAAYGTTAYHDPGSRTVVPDTIYDIASLTKLFTATAALRLIDARECRLDDPLRRFLPELRAGQVTLRQLLTHSSGLNLRLSVLREQGADGIRRAVYAAEPEHPPGTCVAYTNINSLLLGAVVALVFGSDLAEAIDKLVLEPLDMQATHFNPPEALHARIAPTEWDHDWRGGLVQGVVHDESAYALGGAAGHAGLFSTAADLSRFCRFWLQRGAWQGRQLLHESTVAEAVRNHTAGMTTPDGQELACGLGWMLDRENFMGHAPSGSFGHTGFTGPAIVILPHAETALVVLSNRTYPQRTPPPYRHHRVTAALVEWLLA
jgi:CubicO group peptidase (beta-lactamase class C family)